MELKMAKSFNKRLERLKQQREIIDARINAVQARAKTSERKKDIRRKILVGAYYLDIAIKENKMDEIKEIMDKYLNRDSDRELFELQSLEK